jgi:hypothetical protein
VLSTVPVLVVVVDKSVPVVMVPVSVVVSHDEEVVVVVE